MFEHTHLPEKIPDNFLTSSIIKDNIDERRTKVI